jgi:hypothetical protein
MIDSAPDRPLANSYRYSGGTNLPLKKTGGEPIEIHNISVSGPSTPLHGLPNVDTVRVLLLTGIASGVIQRELAAGRILGRAQASMYTRMRGTEYIYC